VAIAFVAAGTTFSATGSGTSFTLNKPAGVAVGDTMVAAVACWANGSQKTITATGWTLRQTAYRDVVDDQIQLSVFTRVVESGDPASWTATASGSVFLRTAGVAAYSGVQGIGSSGQTNAASATSLASSTVNNTVDQSWRVHVGACFAGSVSVNISSNETSRRYIVAADNSGAIQQAIWDSNTGIVTGNTSRTLSRSSAWECAGSVILLLNNVAGTPASGTMAQTLAPVDALGDGEVHDDGALGATLPAVAVAMDGYGQPPVVTGPIASTLAPVSASASGGTDVIGTLGAIAPVTVELVAETRAFGVRVIVVERDDRTIKVESRAVAD
jgi:hypothetical protein